jgi:hypothetical protein
VVKQSWRHSSQWPFHQKTKYLVIELKTRRRTKPKLTDQLETIEQQISNCRYLLNYRINPYRKNSPSSITLSLPSKKLTTDRDLKKLGDLSGTLDHTFLTLIPKKATPTIPQDLRPISLCNVIYKIIAKSLAAYSNLDSLITFTLTN